LSEAEIWKVVRVAQQEATFRQVGAVLGVHSTGSVAGHSSTSCKVFDNIFSLK
jgi:hypothetical protein